MKEEHIIIQHSSHSVKETADRLEAVLQLKGITLYARINQHEEAAKAGITITELEYLLFGNPAAGGKLMAFNPVIALDLPLKIMIWRNEQNDTLVAYNGPQFFQERYGLTEEQVAVLNLKGLVAQIV